MGIVDGGEPWKMSPRIINTVTADGVPLSQAQGRPGVRLPSPRAEGRGARCLLTRLPPAPRPQAPGPERRPWHLEAWGLPRKQRGRGHRDTSPRRPPGSLPSGLTATWTHRATRPGNPGGPPRAAPSTAPRPLLRPGSRSLTARRCPGSLVGARGHPTCPPTHSWESRPSRGEWRPCPAQKLQGLDSGLRWRAPWPRRTPWPWPLFNS